MRLGSECEFESVSPPMSVRVRVSMSEWRVAVRNYSACGGGGAPAWSVISVGGELFVISRLEVRVCPPRCV